MENKTMSGNTKIKYPMFPLTPESYYNNIKKMFEKYVNFNRPDYMDKSNISGTIPTTIPANGYDIYNYLAKYGIASFQLQIIMKLDGRLDFDKLEKAVRLSFDIEPVFGCRFINSNPPHWKRFDDIDNIKFCSLEETNNSDEAVERFLESSMNMDKDPMVMVKLIRSSEEDTLGVKINHVCCDGAGAKEYIQLLADIYTRIDNEENDFVPNPSIRSREDHNNLVSALKECNPMTSYTPMQQTPLTTWSFPWKNIRIGNTGFAICKLPMGYLEILNKYAKARGATINDLLLTAFFRAMFEKTKAPYGIPMDISVTTDLRKYLPEHKTEAIRNFSGGIILRIGRKYNELFSETLSRVMKVTEALKNRHPSVQDVKKVELYEIINFRQICACIKAFSQFVDFVSQNPFVVINRCSPVLSNIGLISKSLIKFGENTVTDLNCFPPAIRAPGILLVVGTYNGIITLTVGYYKTSVRKSDMEGLLNKIKAELIEGCRQ